MRSLAALLIAVLGYGFVTYSLAGTLRSSAPDRAYALSSTDGRTAALLSAQMIGTDRARAVALANLALHRDPTAVPAVTTLGLAAQLNGNTAKAQQHFRYATTLSRRNLQAQLWMIEDSITRQDIAGALRHYDIALRTSAPAPELLYPVLASALSAPEVRTALARTLLTRPAWAPNFIGYAAGNAPDPRAAASLFVALQRHGMIVPQNVHAVTLDRLLSQDLLEEAWRYYAAVRPGSSRHRSRDPQFGMLLTEPSVFDWVPVTTGGITAAIQQNGSGGIFVFAAPPSVGGTALRQYQMLPPGDYGMTGRSIDIQPTGVPMPYWMLSCRNERELGRVALTSSSQANGHFSGRLRVPADCPVQILSLIIPPSDAVQGISGQISEAILRPIR
ncbi:hypothetical protein [Sphingomonas sp. 2SG]|uniref:tetratricopeptide repeat protein n=1 Tax=Sphingomonas sp. 2SG TaxID=2502201 RepID=UPI0010F9898D|nr:hypothetical protein [Sphingomonas sp. 2SG]